MSQPNAVQPSVDWVATPQELLDVVSQAIEQPQYAIDTEFLRERTFFPRLALIQIFWPNNTFLIDPLAVDVAPLAALFESDSLAVFHAAEQDLEVLESACGVIPNTIFDTQVAAGFLGFSSPSLLTLAEKLLGVKLSKGDRLTDWTQRPLTKTQLSYAASDVEHLIELRRLLAEQLERFGRQSWCDDEFQILRSRPRAPEHGPRAWWKLKDGRVLHGRDRLYAQRLCIWREQRARSDDRPLRFVLPDLAVIAIAQRKPKSLDELQGVRGMEQRYLRSGVAEEILRVLQDASSAPISELELPEPEDFDPKLRPALALVSAWVAQLAHDAQIDPALLATRSDLAQFLGGSETCRLRTGWRQNLVGTAIEALVSGHAALAFELSGQLKLETRSGASFSHEPIPEGLGDLWQ